jgi:hypothetical protein
VRYRKLLAWSRCFPLQWRASRRSCPYRSVEDGAGPYVRAHRQSALTVDPKLPGNRIITDVDLGPRNGEGLTSSPPMCICCARKGEWHDLCEVSNRGRKGLFSTFNLAGSSSEPRAPEHFGGNFLLDQGFTIVWLAWQWDLPPEPGLMRFCAPTAKGVKGARARRLRSRSEDAPLLRWRSHSRGIPCRGSCVAAHHGTRSRRWHAS